MTTNDRLLAAIVKDPADVPLRLVYADWLEENGDVALAAFIRARCALDGCVPDAETYPSLVERALESLAGQREPAFEVPAIFSTGCWWDSTAEEWWSDARDLLEGGLLSSVETNEGDAKPLLTGVRDLVRATPARGIGFESDSLPHLSAVLSSPAGRRLRRVALEGPVPAGASESPVQTVASSPAAEKLTRLAIGHVYYQLNDADAAALANGPFDRLERLDVHFNDCSRAGLRRLMDAPWFRGLRRLMIGFNPACARDGARRLGGMSALHSLCLWMPDDPVFDGLGMAQPLPDLRRLFIHYADLRGELGASLGRLKAPKLIELWLRHVRLGKADLKALAATPLFDGLRVLTFDGVGLTHTALDAVAARPSAKALRILRVKHSGFRSLARSAIARPGAFPALTTLVLSSPFTGKERDTAAFLAALDTPALRHLTLEYCDFDNACMDAIAGNPAFARLTRLVVRGGFSARGEPIVPKAETLRRFLGSTNLRNLIVLELWDCHGGDGAEILADPSVLPRLAKGILYGVTGKVASALSGRPAIDCIT